MGAGQYLFQLALQGGCIGVSCLLVAETRACFASIIIPATPVIAQRSFSYCFARPRRR